MIWGREVELHRIAVRTSTARRILLRTTTGTLLVLTAGWTLLVANSMIAQHTMAIDYAMYEGAARRWLSGGAWYLPEQVSGPYAIHYGDVLYPPTLLWLLVPFTLLPAICWWAVPFFLAAWGLLRLQLHSWAWPMVLACMLWPTTAVLILTGNPVIWAAALTILGLAYGWGGAFVFVKPSLFPFALLGISQRRWWLAIALLTLLSVPLLPTLLRYPTVILNSRGPRATPLYSVPDVPLMLVALVAWIGRSRQPLAPARGHHGGAG